jgi:cell division septation protein DedD
VYMSVEKKKLLLVAVSVGIFLVIVIGASILVFAPPPAVPDVSTRSPPPVTPDPSLPDISVITPGSSGTTGTPSNTPDTTSPGNATTGAAAGSAASSPLLGAQTLSVITVPPATEDTSRTPATNAVASVQAGGASVADPVHSYEEPLAYLYVNGERVEGAATVSNEKSANGTVTIINLTLPEIPQVPTPSSVTITSSATALAAAAAIAPVAQTGTASPQAAVPQAAIVAANTGAALTARNTASTQTTASVQSPQTTTQPKISTYWVQVGSYSTKSRADGVKESLAAKGMLSIIQDTEVNGTLYFRVRIGPYTSQSEANYWLSLLKAIAEFKDSRVLSS